MAPAGAPPAQWRTGAVALKTAILAAGRFERSTGTSNRALAALASLRSTASRWAEEDPRGVSEFAAAIATALLVSVAALLSWGGSLPSSLAEALSGIHEAERKRGKQLDASAHVQWIKT